VAALDDVNDLLAAFLVAAADALTLTDEGPPARIYMSSGRPALDCCGQLTCWATNLGNADSIQDIGGMASPKRQQSRAQPVLTVVIQATRCTVTTKDGRAPSPEALAGVSRMTNQDLWALWNHLNRELRDGTLAKICKGVWRDGAVAVDAQGGCVGWEITYRVPIDGGLLDAT
jgi:hypothetical protein